MSEDYCLLERSSADPPAADYCLILDSDDMAPYIKPGDRVYVSCREPLSEMDAGLFLLDGCVLCRQWCEDYSGALLLLCANPHGEAGNIRLSREERNRCLCLGKLLLKKPLPPPVYTAAPQN